MMPELPEVETLCRQLQERIKGKKIKKSMVLDAKLEGCEPVAGRMIRDVRRIGKTISLCLDDGRVLSIHLRMTGRLLWHRSKDKLPHTRWRLTLEEGFLDLVDPRRFATIKIGPALTTPIANDLIQKFDLHKFMGCHAGRSVNVKVLLMDPKAIAGIGNIYACEILHRAGVSPAARSSDVSPAQWKKIFAHGRRILKKGIDNRGTSISDWRDLYGHPGENQRELKVYGREGKTCSICGGVIRRIKQGGRSTYYCPDCQK